MYKVQFTGFDSFLFALEKQEKFRNAAGNTCRYVLELDTRLEAAELRDLLLQSELACTLGSFRAVKTRFWLKPRWQQSTEANSWKIQEIESDELLPKEILQSKISIDGTCLSFGIIHRSAGNSALVFSWHHLLMDGFGAALFLKSIFLERPFSEKDLGATTRDAFTLKHFAGATKAKFFVDSTSLGKLAGVSPKVEVDEAFQKLKILQFSEEESRQFQISSQKAGVAFGLSSFLLACLSRAVHQLLESRGEKPSRYWVPMPNDRRKRGSNGPIVGNWLTFFFYRIKATKLKSLKEASMHIQLQMKKQIKEQRPEHYNNLMDAMAWLPTSLYFYLVKRRGKNPLASFLFTIGSEHPKELHTLLGKKVKNAISVPHNTLPPGLTFAFMKYNNCWQMMLLYYEHVLSEAECDSLIKQVKHEIITGTEYN